MKKDKEEKLDYSSGMVKKGFFKSIFAKKSETKKVLEYISKNKIKNFLFYTSAKNLLQILQFGISKIAAKKIPKGEEYVVWTYLENDNSIGLEFDNSSRNNFWKWVTESQVSIDDIAVIGINPDALADASKNDWALDSETLIVYVYDKIPVDAIDWIMIKNKQILARVKTLVESNGLNIDVYFGEHGNIK